MSLSVVRAEAAAEPELSFADFWTLYPKRVARMEAEKRWNQLTVGQKLDAITALVDWRKYWLRKVEPEFIPYASTWLYQQRWTDELPDAWGANHASHIAAAMPEQGERAAMPDHVRALLAKLRAK